jgi:microcystin-dependent protein
MKINNKGYASTIIMFSILTLFLISMLMLVKTMNNSSTLNKQITEKVVDNIDYDASGTVQDQIFELKTTITSMQNQIDNIKGEVINEIYPVGSIYMSTEDDTVEKVQSKFGGTWEKYSQGRTLIGEGTGTDSNGLIQTFTNGSMGGEYTHTLNISEMPSHTHTQNPHFHRVGFDNGKTRIGLNAGVAQPDISMYIGNYGFGARVNTMITDAVTATNNNTGGNSPHNNIEPYIVTYMYRRIR